MNGRSASSDSACCRLMQVRLVAASLLCIACHGGLMQLQNAIVRCPLYKGFGLVLLHWQHHFMTPSQQRLFRNLQEAVAVAGILGWLPRENPGWPQEPKDEPEPLEPVFRTETRTGILPLALKHRKPPFPRGTAGPKTETAQTVPPQNCNRTEPNWGHTEKSLKISGSFLNHKVF